MRRKFLTAFAAAAIFTLWGPVLPAGATTSGARLISHEALDELLKAHVKEGWVDYKGLLAKRAELRSYLRSLESIPPAALAEVESAKKKSPEAMKEWLALWINAYNAYTADLILQHHPVKSIKDIPKRWDVPVVRVAGKAYTLNDVEHKNLRLQGEPRIHMAIVCASVGCPPLLAEAYAPERLEEQLDSQARLFFNTPKYWNLDRAGKTLSYSKILKWFEEDFVKKSGDVLHFARPSLSQEDWNFIEENFIKASFFRRGTVKLLDYDWSLNGK